MGGTGLKAALLAEDGAIIGERLRVATPYPCPPPALIEALRKLTSQLPAFDRV